MNSAQVVSIIRAHEPELRAAGVKHLRLFGSVARGDANAQSDIDLVAEMNESPAWTLFTLGRIQMDLSDWLGNQVDLSPLHWLRPSIRERVLSEAVDAF